MELKEKQILIIGSGISGIAAAALIAHTGAYLTLFDDNEKLSPGEVLAKLPEDVQARIYTGSLPGEVRRQTQLVIVSPGVPVDTPFIGEFKERGIPVWGEIELAYRFARGRLMAITGTNG